MGRLRDFLVYLDDRIRAAQAIEERLCALQQKYERYYAEVSRVRAQELAQLAVLVTGERAELPGWLSDSLARAYAKATRELDAKLARLRAECGERQRAAETVRQESLAAQAALHRANADLDAEEEQLKARSAVLLAQIADYNARIRAFAGGFGFFANLFKMRALAAERRALDDEQASLAARIDSLRRRWQQKESAGAEREELQRQAWLTHQTGLAALRAKLEHVEATRGTLVKQSALEEVLFELGKEPLQPATGDPPCPRCRMPNPRAHYFCYICAQRLQPDRPDLEGSIEEIAEVNLHHRRFSEGMRAGQELIGLVRGLKSGLESFRLSVESVLASEQKFPLPKLEIEVPAPSVEWGRQLDALGQAVGQDLSLHPVEFAVHVQKLLAGVFTTDNIKRYFEGMGEELSRQAKAQWR
jgi:hypothetical protein